MVENITYNILHIQNRNKLSNSYFDGIMFNYVILYWPDHSLDSLGGLFERDDCKVGAVGDKIKVLSMFIFRNVEFIYDYNKLWTT